MLKMDGLLLNARLYPDVFHRAKMKKSFGKYKGSNYPLALG